MIDKLARLNMWMFQQVRCRRYLKKVRDGRFINVDSVGNAEYVDTSRLENGDVWHEPVSEEDYDGSKNFLKTYYEVKEKQFTGVVVGFKMVTITRYLIVDIRTEWDGTENTIVDKLPNEQIKCALVYYGCNKSRLVPMDSLEIMTDD